MSVQPDRPPPVRPSRVRIRPGRHCTQLTSSELIWYGASANLAPAKAAPAGKVVADNQTVAKAVLTTPRSEMAVIQAVFFDVGEAIVDETREYGTWADWLGIPRHTFSAVFGAVIARGGDYRETFQHFKPGFDLNAERELRAAVGEPEAFGEENLYPDARPCLAALREQGLRVGLAGNQTSRAEIILRSLDLPVDVIGTSDGWAVEKPAAGFFERVIAEAGCPRE